MPTNDERREVATRLREPYPRFTNLVDAFGLTAPVPIHELRYRLADLIEPEERTCRMTVLENARGNPKYFLMYVCSECHGAVVHTQNDPIYYCPNCGAKVVD